MNRRNGSVIVKETHQTFFNGSGREATGVLPHPVCPRAIRNLAEAIILQSIEDLLESAGSRECREFFDGEGFELCADMAGLTYLERRRLIFIIRKYDGIVTAAWKKKKGVK